MVFLFLGNLLINFFYPVVWISKVNISKRPACQRILLNAAAETAVLRWPHLGTVEVRGGEGQCGSWRSQCFCRRLWRAIPLRSWGRWLSTGRQREHLLLVGCPAPGHLTISSIKLLLLVLLCSSKAVNYPVPSPLTEFPSNLTVHF